MFRKFADEPLPFYCSIETEVNADQGGGGGAPPPEPEGGGAQRQSIRESLEKGFEQSRVDDKGRATKEKTPRRIAGGAEIDGAEEKTQDVGVEGAGDQQVEKKDVGPAPDAFSKEAKAEWANVPANVQTAILKREQDMAKGVQELKQRYADIDQALAPHVNAIRQHGNTPAQAVQQLFNWMQALAANPTVAFPALAKSFNFDLGKLLQQQGQPAPQQGEQPKSQEGGDIPPLVKDYITKLEKQVQEATQQLYQKVGSLETNWQRDSEVKTNQLLMNWAKDKPHFEAVRQHMAHLIGSGAVQLKEDGSVDLDKAYDMAVYALPDVRAQVLEAQRVEERKQAEAKAAAERKAQADAAAKSRQAAVSVNSGSPGAAGGSTSTQKKGPRRSVKESLLEAIEQHRS